MTIANLPTHSLEADSMICPECYSARDYNLCISCGTCSICCDCEGITMTPADYIASLPHGESKAAALQVYNLMRLVWITSQPNRMTPTKKDVAEEAQS